MESSNRGLAVQNSFVYLVINVMSNIGEKSKISLIYAYVSDVTQFFQ